MKKISVILSVFLLSSILVSGQTKSGDKDEMLFDKTSHDFGQMVYASDATVIFKFRNNSKQPIAITNVKSSCGCTVPTWTREPIQPGESNTITVAYNTTIPGSFNKTIQVFSTANNSPVRLSVRGSVSAKEKNAGSAVAGDQTETQGGAKLIRQGSSTFPVTKAAKMKQSGELSENPVKKQEELRKKK